MEATDDLPSGTFAERLLQVIDEGQRTATYKLALLLALIDATAEGADAAGRPPAVLGTRTIADHVVRLYFPQVRLYLAGDGSEHALRQITVKESVAIRSVLRLEMTAKDAGCRTIDQAKRALPEAVERCLDGVELNFVRYPILRLQNVGRSSRPFIYDIDWTEAITLKRLRARGVDHLRFRPGAADHLLRLAPLIRPLVEVHWTRMVGQLNGLHLEEESLRHHLFGVERLAFPSRLRHGVIDLQDGNCFYCGSRLGSRSEIDHFLPWVRYPNNAIENLVAADRCNGNKRHHLVTLEHVGHWADRLRARSADLESIADESGWLTEPVRSLALIRSGYAHLPAGTPLWNAIDEFVEEPISPISQRLSEVGA